MWHLRRNRKQDIDPRIIILACYAGVVAVAMIGYIILEALNR